MAEYSPTDAEIHLGQKAYVTYLGAVAIINMPDSLVARGVLADSDSGDPEAELTSAEQLLYSGLRGIISFASPPEWRSNLQRQAEHGYWQALPHMITIVESAYDHMGDVIEQLNPAFAAMRPAPMYDQPTYHNICHGRRYLLSTVALLDGFVPGKKFQPLMAQRTLAGAAPAHKAKRIPS